MNAWLAYPFVQRALLGGVFIGVLTAWVGTFVVLRNMAFMGAGVGHAAFGGVALGLLLGVDPILTAAGFCVLVAWAITTVTRRGLLGSDTVIGIAFSATMALGVLLLGRLRGGGTDVFGYLFGSVLALRETDLLILAVVGGGILLLLVLFHRGWVALAFDPEFARVAGLPETLLDYLFSALVALTVVLSIRMVGLILASALLVLPAAVALPWSRNFRTLLGLAVAVGVLDVVLGLAASLAFNTPPGATIVLVASGFFSLSWLAHRAMA